MQDDIKKSLETLYDGGIILYPTDMGWALGCDAINESAVKRMLELKKQATGKVMEVLIDNPGKLLSYVDEVPDIAWNLIELTDKPLTIIYSGAKNLASNLLAADKSIGIRVTDEFFSKNLCARFRKPIVSASANFNGEAIPANFSQIKNEIKLAVDYVVNFRQQELSRFEPSAIIKLGKGNLFQLIRK